MERISPKITATTIIALLTVAVLACIFFLGPRNSDYRIGLLYPATGESARLEKVCGTQLNSGKSVSTRSSSNPPPQKLKLDYRNTQGQPSVARNQFLALADLDKVPVVVGSLLSSDTLAFIRMPRHEG